MRYIIDHDLHIHSYISPCSENPEQNAENILHYGIENGYKKICITDHFWDKDVAFSTPSFGGYDVQNSDKIREILPLPQSEHTKFLFGGECDMDFHGNVGITDKFLDKLDFLIIPFTHTHFANFSVDSQKIEIVRWQIPATDYNIEYLADQWVKRFDKVLSLSLPFEKIGIAHPTWFNFDDSSAIPKLFDLIDKKTLAELFTKAAKLGVGIEINTDPKKEKRFGESTRKVYTTAKECGCKFYFGSDAHNPSEFVGRRQKFEELVDWIGLEEEDKFAFVNK